MAKQTVPLYTVASGQRLERARVSLAEALSGAELGTPDEAGTFDVTLEADSAATAEDQIREALATSGTGDDFVLRESIAGHEMPADDPRQPEAAEGEAEEPPPPSPDERAEHIRTAASRVEQMARQLAEVAPSPLEEAAERLAQEAPQRIEAAARRLAEAPPTAGETPPTADEAIAALQRRNWRKIGPPAAAILGLLVLLRRITRRS